jgi:hypothetical protein
VKRPPRPATVGAALRLGGLRRAQCIDFCAKLLYTVTTTQQKSPRDSVQSEALTRTVERPGARDFSTNPPAVKVEAGVVLLGVRVGLIRRAVGAGKRPKQIRGVKEND